MVAREIGDQQRGVRGPPFMFAVGLDDARAGRVQAAALHQPVAPAAQGIVQRLVGEREQVGLPGRILRMPRIAPGLAEAKIGRHAAASPRHAASGRRTPCAPAEVLVETEIEEIAQKAAGLRNAEADRALDEAGRRRRADLPAWHCAGERRPRRASPQIRARARRDRGRHRSPRRARRHRSRCAGRVISTVCAPVARMASPAGCSRGASHFCAHGHRQRRGSAIGHDKVAVAGERMWSNTNSSRAGPVTPRSTGAGERQLAGFEGMSACQPIQAMV